MLLLFSIIFSTLRLCLVCNLSLKTFEIAYNDKLHFKKFKDSFFKFEF